MVIHLDTDFLIYALADAGHERCRLVELAESDSELELSAIAWYEFCRGPRTPEQLATARALFGAGGIVTFSERAAGLAAEVFRSLGCPRRRAADIAIGVTAVIREARLLTRNANDFAGIPHLQVEQSG